MTYVIAILAAGLGTVVGWAAAAMIGIGIASAIGLSSADDAAGTFAILGVGPIGGALGLTFGIWLVLRARGHKTFGGLATRGVVVLLMIGGLVAGGAEVARVTGTTPWRQEPNPALEFEIRAPVGFEFARTGIAVELQPGGRRAPSLVRTDPTGGNDRAVLAGRVELQPRTAGRFLVLSLPEQPKRLFQLDLSARPQPAVRFGPWRPVDLLDDKRPDRTPRPAPDTDGFDIRVRVADLAAAR
jgi:hypothetical protein